MYCIFMTVYFGLNCTLGFDQVDVEGVVHFGLNCPQGYTQKSIEGYH